MAILVGNVAAVKYHVWRTGIAKRSEVKVTRSAYLSHMNVNFSLDVIISQL